MTQILEGRVGIVTGGANGIGRASALALARAGATVIIVDQPSEVNQGESVAREAGNGSVFVSADVTSSKDWDFVIETALKVSGHLDFAHNNAGIGLALPLLETTKEQFQHLMNVNVYGVWLGMQKQLSVMTKQGFGAIVNTSSLAGLKGLAQGSLYSATKHAVIGMTKSAAIEFAPQEIRVNAVCPAATDTAMTRGLSEELREMIVAPQAMKRFAEPHEIGAAVVWLCSPQSSFITGFAFPVDGGATAT